MVSSPAYIAIVANLSHYSVRQRLEAFARETRSFGLPIRFFEQSERATAMVKDRRCAGLFLCNIDPETGFHAALASVRKPIVEASRKIPTRWPQVFMDENRLADMAYSHFQLLQRDQFAYCGRENNLGSMERMAAFEARTTDQPGIFVSASLDLAQAKQARQRFDQLLQQIKKPACLLCYEDRIAEKVLEECEERGLSVPEDIALLSCGDDPLLSELAGSGISSVVFPGAAIGTTAARLLHRWLEGEKPEKAVHRVPPEELHVRDSSDPTASSDSVIARAIAYMRDNTQRAPQVDEIARAAGSSRRSLELRFRDKLNKSVRDQLMELRMEKARLLLRTTSLSMESIAEACGCSSGATFSRAYRAWTGSPPSAHR